MTSLDIYELQSLLAIAKDSGCKIAVLEVSSHGMDQNRFEGTDFDLAVLTNITHDHLDYHGTMDHYTEAKKKLFNYVLRNSKANKYAVFPADDAVGRKWFEEMSFDKKINFSITSSSMLKAEKITMEKEGMEFAFSYLGKTYMQQTKLI
jgi:UDP-N-acetylmuramyl tripeptide synthase